MIKAQSEWLASNHRTLLGKGPWLMFKFVFPLYTIRSSISNDTDLLLYNFQEILYNPSIVWEIVPGFLQYRLAKTSTAAAVASSVARSLLSNGGQKWISVKFVHTVDHLKKNFLKKFLLEHLTPLLFFPLLPRPHQSVLIGVLDYFEGLWHHKVHLKKRTLFRVIISVWVRNKNLSFRTEGNVFKLRTWEERRRHFCYFYFDTHKTMGIRVFISGNSGNKEVRQLRQFYISIFE